jgi:aryl-alcohol dehydrogenase-like predicted oxidoreductase
VALAWVLGRPGVDSGLIGATKRDQLDRNLAALSLRLPPESSS